MSHFLSSWILSVPCALVLAGTAMAQEPGRVGPNDPEGTPEQTTGRVSQGATIRSAAEAPLPKPTTPVSTAPPAQPGGGPAPDTKEVKISIGNTGTADWDYRNLRNPPLVWKRGSTPLVDLQFFNITAGLTVKLTFTPVTIPDGPTFQALSLLGLGPADTRDAVLAQYVNAQRLADEAALVAVGSSADLARGATALQAVLARAESDVRCAVVKWETPGTSSCADVSVQTVKDRIRAWREAAAPDQSWTTTPAATALAVFLAEHKDQAGTRAPRALEVALSQSARVSEMLIRLLESPSPVVAQSTAQKADAANKQDATLLAARGTAEKLFGVVLNDCTRQATEVLCTPTLTLAPNSAGVLRNALLERYPAHTVIRFRINFPFGQETEQPPSANGYFAIDEALNASPTTVSWTASGVATLQRLPYFGDAAAAMGADFEYDGAFLRQLRGNARAVVNYTLGDRASASVEVSYKNGVLGTEPALSANQYQFEAFGFRGTSLKFGKYLFASPTDGIAINESGEGLTARYKSVAVSRIIRREGTLPSGLAKDRDHAAWLVDVSSIPIRGWTSLRWISLYGLFGRDDADQHERNYRTVGGEIVFGLPIPNLTGTVAYYGSRSRARNGSAAQTGTGSAKLLRLSRGWFSDGKAAHTLVVTVAEGSGDQPGSSNTYDGYLGENAGYVPDGSLFIGSIVPRLRLRDAFLARDKSGAVLTKDGKDVVEFSDRGLSNRRFIGLSFTEQSISPLEWLAGLAQVPKKDVAARQTTMRLHYYAPTQPLLGSRNGSWEAQVETLLESPAGVKYSVKASRFLGRGSLEPLFTREPWSFVMQCIVTIKT